MTNTIPTTPMLYSRKAAATALSICLKSLDLLIASGKIAVVHVGRRTLIHASELARFASVGSQENLRRAA